MNKTITWCPEQGTCEFESIFLAEDRETRQFDGGMSSARKLWLKKRSNWWSYQAFDSDGNIGLQSRELNEIIWKATGSGGEDCLLSWEPVIVAQDGTLVPYSKNSALFSFVETLDRADDSIVIRWSHQVAEPFRNQFNAERERYELRFGFKVRNAWSLSPDAPFETLLFNLFLETAKPYCASLEPYFITPSQKKNFFLTETVSSLAIALQQGDLRATEAKCHFKSLL